jgi:hypothetical protein
VKHAKSHMMFQTMLSIDYVPVINNIDAKNADIKRLQNLVLRIQRNIGRIQKYRKPTVAQ